MSALTGSAQQHINYATFDGLRGVAAVMVVIFHLAYRAEWAQVITHGYLAVDLFFGLSGFVIAQAYSPHLQAGMSLVQFTILRLVRLYPLYFLGQLLGLCILALFGHDAMLLIKAFILGSIMIPWPIYIENIPPIFPLNGPSWSLFFEMAINIAFALTVAMLSSRVLLSLLAVSALALVAAAMHFGSLHLGWNAYNLVGAVPRVGFSFIAGILLFRFAPRIRTGNMVPLLVLVALLPLLIIGPKRWWLALAIIMLVFPPMLYLAASWQPTGAVKTICHELGRISYPLYIIHTPALYLGEKIISDSGIPEAWKVIAWATLVVLIVVTSAILPNLYDKPVRSAIERAIKPYGSNAQSTALKRL